ncbi:MAG TPA: hypothetical protein VLE74_03080, partial [Candidatus Saccharimonadales bacterium]|nr:hypothetical protein [Candidatus Saccharimonadales bacterium]
MPDSSGAQEIIGVETGQESRRPRFGFLRRGGHLAIESAQVVPAVEISGASDTLLGLEDQLAEYQGLWNDHRAVSQAALSDETTKTLFQEVLGQYEERSLIPTWEKRRALQKLIQTGYGRFISVYIGMGRVKHSITAQYRGEHSLVPASPGSSMVEASAFSKLTSKKGALLSPDNLGAKQPNIVELMKKMDAVEVAASRTYKPISRLEVQMSKRIYETVGDDSSKALMLVESFTSCAESEAGIEKTFARFLANRFQAFGDRSELGSALSLVEHHAALGAFAQNFIAQKLTEHEGDNILAYFARRLSESEGAFEADMAARFEDWPAEYREEYASYATTRLKQLTVQVAKTAERSQYPDWALPDSDMLEDEIDQLIHTLSLRYDNKKMYVHKARPSSRKAGNRAGSVNVADQFESVERVSEPRKVNMVVRGKD